MRRKPDKTGRSTHEIRRQTHEKGKGQTDEREEQGQQEDLQEETYEKKVGVGEPKQFVTVES